MCLEGHRCQAHFGISGATGAFVSVGPFLHQKKKKDEKLCYSYVGIKRNIVQVL